MQAMVATGLLDARSGHNHYLLGLEMRANAEEPLATLAPLGPADIDDGVLHARLGVDPADVDALCQLGLSALRCADPRHGGRWFRRAIEADPHYFPAQLGLAASMRVEEQGTFSAVKRLGEAPDNPAWAPLFPDWAVLTTSERRIVAASVSPLQHWAMALMEQGAQLRILPLEARLADVGEGEWVGAWIHDLLDVDESGWPVAEQVAWRAFGAMEADDQRAVLDLVADAEENPHNYPDLDLSDPNLFFARCYVDWLADRHSEARGRPMPAPVEKVFAAMAARKHL